MLLGSYGPCGGHTFLGNPGQADTKLKAHGGRRIQNGECVPATSTRVDDGGRDTRVDADGGAQINVVGWWA